MNLRASMWKRMGALAALAALVAAPLAWAADKGPDAAGYRATDNVLSTFEDLAVEGSGASNVLGGTDEGVALLTLPFPFQFYGKSYTLVCASVNGLLAFVTAADACTPTVVDFANRDLTSTAAPGDRPSALPYWSDLTFEPGGSGAVYYKATGAAGSRHFTVEWRNAFHQDTTSNPVTFEAVLYEGGNNILFQYQTVNLGDGNAASKGAKATVGIRDAGGQTNNRQIAWSYNAPVLSDSQAIQFTPPPEAQMSVNTVTTSPAGLTVTIDGYAYVTPKVVSWKPGTSHTLAIATPQTGSGTRNTLTAWSTGAATAQITVTTPATGTTYAANFLTEYQLTTATNPATVGSVSGAGWYSAGTSASVLATVPTGYALAYFSGDASGSANPVSVVMNAAKRVVANYLSSVQPSIVASMSGKANDGAIANQRKWTIKLANGGPGAADAVTVTAITITQSSGAACATAPAVLTPVPLAVGSIASGSSLSPVITINFAGCSDAAARFALKLSFSANSNAYSGSSTINSQTR
jgi:hypothetical protein